MALLAAVLVMPGQARAYSVQCSNGGIACISFSGYTGNSVWGYPVDGSGNNCTNYAAFRLSRNGAGNPGNLGNAGSWAANAAAKGFAVNGTPTVGSIAQWNYGSSYAPSSGHVAYVEEVTANDIALSDSNWQGGSKRWRVSRGDRQWPSNFLHIRDVDVTIGEGSFIQVAGRPEVYRIAGGAPLYISNWANVGGPQHVSVISQARFDGLRGRPVDGTYVVGSPRGEVYVFAGGAPLYVSSWDHVGGGKHALPVDVYALDNPQNPASHTSAYPANGTFVAGGPRGEVYTFAGGAPLYVSSWNSVGGPKPTTAVDIWALDNAGHPISHTRPYPADGTFVTGGPRGEVYTFAGGAPIYVSNWDHVGGVKPTTLVDVWALENSTRSIAHTRHHPADGTFIRSLASPTIYRVAGGAPLPLTSWNIFGGAKPTTIVDEIAIERGGQPGLWSHLNYFPSDGTLLRGHANNALYKVISGAPFAQGQFAVEANLTDSQTIQNAGTPGIWSHLKAPPKAGASVKAAITCKSKSRELRRLKTRVKRLKSAIRRASSTKAKRKNARKLRVAQRRITKLRRTNCR